jgi:hypothetical protein
LKLAFLADSHFGERNDSQEFDRYIWKFYEDIFFPTLDKHQIGTVIHFGDLVDRRKFINFRIMQSTLKLIKYWPNLQWHILVGNHDCPFRNTNSPNAVDLICHHCDNVMVYDKPSIMYLGGSSKFTIIPWINSENYRDSLQLLEDKRSDIVFGHLEILGFDRYAGSPATEGLDPSLFKPYKSVFTGHFHHKSKKGNVEYLGAPYEMVWNDYNDVRGFHIYDTVSGELEFIKNPYTLFRKFFYDDSSKSEIAKMKKAIKENHSDQYVKLVVVKKSNPKLFDGVLQALIAQKPHDIDILEDFGDLVFDDSETDIPTDTMTFINEAIETFELSKETQNKTLLKNLMRDIYMEALSNKSVE